MEIPGYRVGALQVSPGLVLSPMSGVTCAAFRRLMKELNGAALGLVITEFISVEALTRRVPRSLEMMRFRDMERPVGVQIFGYDLGRMHDAARMVQDAGADLVDINCGCPAPKVVRKGGGCELMRQPAHLAKIFQKVRQAVQIPVTMKMRSGWDESSKNAVEIARIAEREGIDGIAVHGRTRAQMYRGEADWNIVAEVSSSVRVPVLGSGDVIGLESARERMTPRNGAPISGLFIGRAALSNPYIFREIREGRAPRLRDCEELALQIARRYATLLAEDFSARAAIGKMKQFVSQMAKGFPWRIDVCRAASFEDQIALIDSRLASFGQELRGHEVSALLGSKVNLPC